MGAAALSSMGTSLKVTVAVTEVMAASVVVACVTV